MSQPVHRARPSLSKASAKPATIAARAHFSQVAWLYRATILSLVIILDRGARLRQQQEVGSKRTFYIGSYIMLLLILRGVFVVLATCIALLYVLPPYMKQGQTENVSISFIQLVAAIGGAICIAVAIIVADTVIKKKRLSALAGILLGLMAGIMVTWALSMVVDLAALLTASEGMSIEEIKTHPIIQGVKIFIGVIMTYLGISLVIQTKDDFRFVIPYVEFAKQVRGTKPVLMDTSAIIDGRILDILDTQIMQGTIIVPKFVLNELQTIADSADKLKRARGRRGLDILQQLQETNMAEVIIDESEVEGTGVDHKLIALAQIMPARVMTNDFNLNKIATLRGVNVININDLANAMKPVALPGEPMVVQIVKAGENASQGVGYLEDGTMVVVENARDKIDQNIELIVTSTLQTSAGRMIFGRVAGDDYEEDADELSERFSKSDSGLRKSDGAIKKTDPGLRKKSSRRNPRRD